MARKEGPYEPDAPASGFRRGSSIHSLALRACKIDFLAGVIGEVRRVDPIVRHLDHLGPL
jgi:hypothetical protein